MRPALALAIVVVLAGCGGGSSRSQVEPAATRIPDVEGIVSAASTDRIVIDDVAYDLAPDASSVSTYTFDPVPVRVGTFVHAGVRDHLVRWVATIGIVSRTTPPRVHYTGRLLRTANGRAIFDDGTALRVPPDLHLSKGFLVVELDPATGEIVRASGS